MKLPIAWHEERLRVREESLARRTRELNEFASEVDSFRAENELIREQIAEAKRRRLDSFDADRLLRKKGT